MAYKLQLPPSTKFHHVSCLKKQLGTNVAPQVVLPQVVDDGLAANTPTATIARRVYKKGNVVGLQLLVQWQDHKESP